MVHLLEQTVGIGTCDRCQSQESVLPVL
jgi:hypothetical protein